MEPKTAIDPLRQVNETSPPFSLYAHPFTGRSGLEFTRKDKIRLHHKIAILTRYDLPEWREAAAQLGAEAFFVQRIAEVG